MAIEASLALALAREISTEALGIDALLAIEALTEALAQDHGAFAQVALATAPDLTADAFNSRLI